jgi:hypothetical protein
MSARCPRCPTQTSTDGGKNRLTHCSKKPRLFVTSRRAPSRGPARRSAAHVPVVLVRLHCHSCSGMAADINAVLVRNGAKHCVDQSVRAFAMHGPTPTPTAILTALTVALAGANCSGELAQKEPERNEMGRQLTAEYYSCVRTSFASQLRTMVDRNMAIDQAFMVCKTEESKLQALESTLSESPTASNAAMLAHRNMLKEELSRR